MAKSAPTGPSIDVPIELVYVSHRKLRKLSTRKITEYARAFEAGADFPPIDVVDCGDFYTIRDGRHRYAAQSCNGYPTVTITIRPA